MEPHFDMGCRVTWSDGKSTVPFAVLCGKCTAILASNRMSMGAGDVTDQRFIFEGETHVCHEPHRDWLVIIKGQDELEAGEEVLTRALEGILEPV